MVKFALKWSAKQTVINTLCAFVVIGTCAVFVIDSDAQEFRSIFNGKDLSGWKGDMTRWSVKDGAITGTTTKERPLPHNQFLILNDSVSDFEFKAEFRLIGDNNSGVQYRSQVIEGAGDFRVKGYQADIHAKPSYTGMLYDEGGRGIVAQRGQRVVVNDKGEKNVIAETDPVVKEDLTAWNTIEIRAVGDRLIHLINGKVTVDITDLDTKNREFKGLLALQIHAGGPMVIQFRKLKLRDTSK
ncbi:MAG: DUF1080 domain-containing protein [Planctomycetaceae bacterium]|jgi:hypothetical protein|nr:DUF1080 domain-containing protein [Planctomycetaceae bacterium]MBT4012759.1 DUF1080 domain-containing protein [Planctomycetaceae bacterium]MBT4725121.1 DUF1080 domain-containing protein [Planctomycetaceae bacterium]MBT4844452.1 DUF1080 domain-containing protein [Planctomycetaceae bacterium]MBT5884834.1 DUF1080 domain-containing protein [Planctomycetaceae bacterium]